MTIFWPSKAKSENFTKGGLRQGAFFLHWKGIGVGYGKLNQWWGEGQHTSIAMTNNTHPFTAIHVGTLEEIRFNKIGLMGRYVFSKLNFFSKVLKFVFYYFICPTH